jgi:hypothetical protein
VFDNREMADFGSAESSDRVVWAVEAVTHIIECADPNSGFPLQADKEDAKSTMADSKDTTEAVVHSPSLVIISLLLLNECD